jgi:His-Xaa-Ser system protein HxsD
MASEKIGVLGVIEYDNEKEVATFSINPKIYSMDIIYSAAYIMIDKAYIILDGDPQSEIIVEFRKKKQSDDLIKLVYEFNEELLNYAVYKIQSEKNKGIREALLTRVLLTNDPNYLSAVSNQCGCEKEDSFDDPEGIMKLWEDSEKAVNDESVKDDEKTFKKTLHN